VAAIEWTTPAFAQLEKFPPKLAFEIVRRVDRLAQYPSIGHSLRSRFPSLKNCRQLIIGRTQRVVYELDEDSDTVYILAVQHCRQRLPTTRALKQALKPPTE
jgi:plasmid stabilization system protein ParE